MEEKWITNRPPTEADADEDGEVRMKLRPDEKCCLYHYVYWSHVAHGAPWQHVSGWEPPFEPAPLFSDVMQACGFTQAAPTESDRIAALEHAALEQRVAELESTMRQLLPGARFRLPAIPQP